MLIFNKFVKREIFIKALNLLESYLKLYIVFYEDSLIKIILNIKIQRQNTCSFIWKMFSKILNK